MPSEANNRTVARGDEAAASNASRAGTESSFIRSAVRPCTRSDICMAPGISVPRPTALDRASAAKGFPPDVSTT